MLNVRVDGRIDIDSNTGLDAAVKAVELKLNGRGRVVLRASGTEPVVRVMVEGEDGELVARLAAELAETVRQSVS
jgi:phosphoglucosamine mutase